MRTDTPSIALAHDYLLVMRGAERTFAEIAKCWPEAPIFTLLYDPDAVSDYFADRDVHTSYLQRIGAKQRQFRLLLPLFPRAAERLSITSADVVISSSSAFAHGLRMPPEAVHVCYCHTPFRYAWFEFERAMTECPQPARPLLRRVLNRIRAWDLAAAKRVTHYVANSAITQKRIEQIYGRQSDIIHPPVAVDRFFIREPEDFVLFVGQIVPHKRVEVAIEAALLAGRRIKIVGTGPSLPDLEVRYGGTGVEFMGNVGDDGLCELYARCAALLVPNVEEFGIAAVEAQAAGRPVVALAQGGARETVVDGETGVLVTGEDAASFAEPLRDENFGRFDSSIIRAHAQRFSDTSFRERFTRLVEAYRTGHDRVSQGRS